MARKKVSILTLRLDEEEAQALEIFKKLLGKKTGSEALRHIIKEFPRWNEITKSDFDKSREIEKKYELLKAANKSFLLSLNKISEVINADK